MSASNSFETSILGLVFNNTNFANIGDATGLRGSTTAGNLFLSLHTSDPGEAGDQTTNETSYTSYARIPVARSSSGWTVVTGTSTLFANTDFPACTGGSATITYFGIGTALTSTGVLLFSGTVTPNVNVSSGVTPRLTTSTTVTCD